MRLLKRKFADVCATAFSIGTAIAGLGVLLWILTDVAMKGAPALDWDFFTKLPSPPHVEGGGLANAIVGTLVMTGLASLVTVPTGILAGTYLAEFGDNAVGRWVGFVADILISAPSIVVGIVVYFLMVRTMGGFSGWAGAAALSVIMFPVVVRTTEEMLKLVSFELRESALALGASCHAMMFGVVFKAAGPGIATGVMLAVARVAGETAPLLFTALSSQYWSEGLGEPMGNLTVVLFNYAMSPYDDWRLKAWGAALLITLSVLFVNIVARVLLPRRGKE